MPDLTCHHVKQDAGIIKQGDVGDSVLIIVSGEANVMRAGERLARLGPSSVVGEMALLNKSIRKVDVVATSPLSYVELKGEDALTWCEESPEFEVELRRFCNNRMIQNLIRTSELFSHFDIATGSLLAQLFVQRTFVAGTLWCLMANRVKARLIATIGECTNPHTRWNHIPSCHLG